MPTDTMNVADEGQTLKCDCCDAALVDWSLAIVAEKESFIRRLGKPEQCPVLALILQQYFYQWPNNRNSTSNRTKSRGDTCGNLTF